MKSEDKVRFSIVVPAYNEEQYIANAINSLKKQNYSGNYEIVVVNNNSNDETASIAKNLGVRVINETRPGVCWARQKGTEIAKGEIIISTDADSVFTSDWLTKIDDRFKNNTSLVAVAGPCRYYDGPLWGKLYPRLLFGAVNVGARISGKLFYITATNIAYKKSVFESYNTELTQGGDELDLLRNLQKKGKVFFDNKNPIYTSARRLERGLFYNIFVSFFIYYFLAYNLNRIFKHRVIGTAHMFRGNLNLRIVRFGQITTMFLFLTLFAFYTNPGKSFMHHSRNLIGLGRHSNRVNK